MNEMVNGHMLADVVAVIGTMDIVLGGRSLMGFRMYR